MKASRLSLPIRWSAGLTAVIVLSAIVVVVLPGRARAAGTTMTVQVKKVDGTPASGADVAIFYMPFDEVEAPIGGGGTYPLMDSGQTNFGGLFNATLNTSMVQTSSLGDNGDGQTQGSFNAKIVVTDTHTNLSAVTSTTVVYNASNGATTAVESSAGTLGTSVTCGIGGVCWTVLGYRYRYERVVAMNSAGGLKATFRYTPSSSVTKQTRTETAFKFEGETIFSAGGKILEQQARSATSPWIQSGSYHRYVWANYRWVHKRYWRCGTLCTVWEEWEHLRFAGQVLDNNPNIGPSGSAIGIRTYTPPPFDNDPNHRLKITDANSGWTRQLGQYYEYTFSLDFAGFLNVQDISSYGVITSMRFDKLNSGCASPKARYVWGDGTDLGAAPIVQASCIAI